MRTITDLDMRERMESVTSQPFDEVIRRQRMVRPPYRDKEVPRELIVRILRNTRKAPTAGFTQGVSFVVLEGDQTEMFWHVTSPGPGDMPKNPDWSLRVTRTPALVIPFEDKQAYLARYAEPDKADWGLGGEENESRWTVPYWTVDAAFATMMLLMSATAYGLGAWFLGIYKGERQLLDALGAPANVRAIGAVALGYASDREVRRETLRRRRKPIDEIVHFGRWASPEPHAEHSMER